MFGSKEVDKEPLFGVIKNTILQNDEDTKRKILLVDIHYDNVVEVSDSIDAQIERVFNTSIESKKKYYRDKFLAEVEKKNMGKKMMTTTLESFIKESDYFQVFVLVCSDLSDAVPSIQKIYDIMLHLRHGIYFHSPLGSLEDFHLHFERVVAKEDGENSTQEYLDGILQTIVDQTDMWCNLQFFDVL